MPIPILQYGVKVRDPTTQQFSDLAALRGGEGPQGAAGPGVPAGGADGDVLVKNGATDYDATWKKTPPQMGSLAYIETTNTVSKLNGYQPGEYLVYNGQLYKVGSAAISQNQILTPGGNITAASIMTEIPGPLIPITSTQTGTEGAYYQFGKIVVFYAKCVKPNTSWTMFYLPAPAGMPNDGEGSLGCLLADDGINSGLSLVITGRGQVQIRTTTFTTPKYIFGCYIAK